MDYKFRNKKGITLIALVVTIIILLILAGISILVLSSENSIIPQATKAKEETEKANEKELIELAVMQSISKENYGELTATKLQGELENNHIEVDSIIGKHTLVLTTKKDRVYEINQNNNVAYIGIKTKYTEATPIMQEIDYSNIPLNSAFWNEQYKTKISKIEIKPYIVKNENIIMEWDISSNQDKSVIAFIVADGLDGYELYIEANDIIKMQDDEVIFFGGFTNCKSITGFEYTDFSNTEDISNFFVNCSNLKETDINYINTGKITNLTAIFAGCEKLETINLSKWNTSSVTRMSEVFQNCTSLKEINLENWNTNNVTNMTRMFNCCYQLERINLSNFNTEKVVNMNAMFYGCGKLKEAKLSSFYTNNVTNFGGMFFSCFNLENLYIDNFYFSESAVIGGNFLGNLPSTAKIYVKNEEIKNRLINELSASTRLNSSNFVY